MEYQDTVAVVTGGASGIGRAICLYLAQKGATVIIADIDTDRAWTVAEEIVELGCICEVEEVDVSKREMVKHLVHTVHRGFGRIDLMVNNAGIGIDGEFRDMTLEHWKRIMDVNLWGVIYGTFYVYPLMIEQGFGQIVNVSSLAGLMPGGLMTGYTASKHAVVGLTLGLRAEAEQYGIKVNALCPGFIETPFHDKTPKVSNYLNREENQRDKSRYPTADKCVRQMMRGIEKDRAIIVSPFRQKIYWWLYRMNPGLVTYGWREVIDTMKSRPD